MSVNWESDVSRHDSSDNDQFYVNVSIPLGRSGVTTSSWYRESEGKRSYGTRAMGSLNAENQYTVGVTQDQEENTTSWDSSLNSNLHYTNLALAAGGDNDSNTNYSAALSGGIVAHSDGVTFSPYRVTDTYAIARLDKPVAGIEMGTRAARYGPINGARRLFLRCRRSVKARLRSTRKACQAIWT